MQDKHNNLVTKAESALPICDTHAQAHTALCLLSFPPSYSDPCQACVNLGDRVTTPSTHTPVCLFKCLCRFIFWRLPSFCPSSAPRSTHGSVFVVRLWTCQLWPLCPEMSVNTEVLDFTCPNRNFLLFVSFAELHEDVQYFVWFRSVATILLRCTCCIEYLRFVLSVRQLACM